MQEELSEALKAAVKSQDKIRISTLRLMTAAIKDRDIAARTADNRDGVSSDEILQILAKMVKQRQEAATTYEEAGRLELAEQERSEIAVIEEFMPRQLDAEAMSAAVDAVIAQLGAESLKDMGKVMGIASSRMAGKADGKVIAGIVRAALNS